MWRDVWFPFKDIGPMKAANPYGAFNLTRDDNSVSFGYSALQSIDDDLVLYLDGKEVFRDHLTLQPMETYEKNNIARYVCRHTQRRNVRQALLC